MIAVEILDPKVWLEPVALASNTRYPAHELGSILRLVRARQPELLEAWHEFFGTGLGSEPKQPSLDCG